MKILKLCLLFLFAVISGLSVSQSFADSNEVLLNPANADRILMIGFKDQHINRVQVNLTSGGYRRRGSYQNSSSWSQRKTSSLAEKFHLEKLTEWPMSEIGVHCAVFLAPPDISVVDLINSISKLEGIDIVQPLNSFRTQSRQVHDPYYQLQSNMQLMEIELAHSRATGKDIVIGIIDTGVDTDHPDLDGQIDLKQNFVSAISKDFREDIHGTAVTGVIAARKDNDAGIIGVAPNARIIALKACWPNQPGGFEASCNSFSLAMAINTAIKMKVDVLNMSLTGPEDPILQALLKKAQQQGIVIVAADPGKNKQNQRFPASLEKVIPVESLEDGVYDVSDLKSIKAPGRNILTTLPNGAYDFISGSSISAAQVSGLIALMLELIPDLNIEQIQSVLLKSMQVKGQVANLSAGKMIQTLCADHQCR